MNDLVDEQNSADAAADRWPELPELDNPALQDGQIRSVLEQLDIVRTAANSDPVAEDPTALYTQLLDSLTAQLDAPGPGPQPHG